MIYCELLTKSTGYYPEIKYAPMLGDRGTFRVDARLSFHSIKLICQKEAEKRKAIGYRIIKGDSLLRSRPVTPWNSVNGGELPANEIMAD